MTVYCKYSVIFSKKLFIKNPKKIKREKIRKIFIKKLDVPNISEYPP